MAKILQLVRFYNQKSVSILGTDRRSEQVDILSATNVSTYSLDFDHVAEDFFGQDYTNTRLDLPYKSSLEVKHSSTPFSIRAGSSYILGEGSCLHAASYAGNTPWSLNIPTEDFKNCWNINQRQPVLIYSSAQSVSIGSTEYISPHGTKTFDVTILSITYPVNPSGVAEYLSWFADAFVETTFAASSPSPNTFTVDLEDASCQTTATVVGTNSVTFKQVHLKGSITNISNDAIVTPSFNLSASFHLYQIVADITAKAQIYDHALDAYDSADIYDSARYYYLYYGDENAVSSRTNCLSFTSSRFEHPYHPNQEVSSDALVSSDRRPTKEQLDPYKPGSSYVLTAWDEDSVAYEATFAQDNRVFIVIKNMVPQWFDPEDIELKVTTILANEGSYSNNFRFLNQSQSCTTKTLHLPAQVESSTYRWYIASGKTTDLFKVVYSGDELKNIVVNGTHIIQDNDGDDKRKYDLQNKYMQINFNSTNPQFKLPSMESSGSVLISSALPVALKFDFDNSKVELYLKVTFSAETPLAGSLTWRIKEPFDLPIIVKEDAAAVNPPYIGQGKKLIGGNRYYSFNADKGYKAQISSGNYSLAFDALFDSQLDKLSVIDKLPKDSGNYSLDYWNKAYPSNYLIRYSDSASHFPETNYRVGVVDSNFIPNFNWSTMTLLRNKFNTTSISTTSSAWTIYKLTSYTTIDSKGQLNYRLSVWYKTNAGYSLAEAYDLSSPLLLLKIVAAGGRGGLASTNTNKGGGGGGSGAGAYLVLDLSFTNSTTTSSRSSNIYICLGRAATVGEDDHSRASYVCFAEPKLSGSDYDSYSISIPSFNNYITLNSGWNGEVWISDSDYNDGGNGGSFSNKLSDATFSYCYVLNYSNGSKGGRGESNSGGSGQYDSKAKAGDSFLLDTRLTSNRRAKSTTNSSLYEHVYTSGGKISTVDFASNVYSPGGGGASSLFADAKQHVNDGSSDPYARYGTGGGGGCCYNRTADVWPHSTYPDVGGEPKAILYYIPKSS